MEREFFDDGGAKAGSSGGFVDAEIDGMMRQFICNRATFMLQSIGSDNGDFYSDMASIPPTYGTDQRRWAWARRNQTGSLHRQG